MAYREFKITIVGPNKVVKPQTDDSNEALSEDLKDTILDGLGYPPGVEDCIKVELIERDDNREV